MTVDFLCPPDPGTSTPSCFVGPAPCVFVCLCGGVSPPGLAASAAAQAGAPPGLAASAAACFPVAGGADRRGGGGRARRHGCRGGAHNGTAATARGAATRSSAGGGARAAATVDAAVQTLAAEAGARQPRVAARLPWLTSWQPRVEVGAASLAAWMAARQPRWQRSADSQAAKMSARGCQNVSAGLPKCQRGAAKMSALGCQNVSVGLPRIMAGLPSRLPRFRAGLPRWQRRADTLAASNGSQAASRADGTTL